MLIWEKMEAHNINIPQPKPLLWKWIPELGDNLEWRLIYSWQSDRKFHKIWALQKSQNKNPTRKTQELSFCRWNNLALWNYMALPVGSSVQRGCRSRLMGGWQPVPHLARTALCNTWTPIYWNFPGLKMGCWEEAAPWLKVTLNPCLLARGALLYLEQKMQRTTEIRAGWATMSFLSCHWVD